jgi:hypothetical protein
MPWKASHSIARVHAEESMDDPADKIRRHMQSIRREVDADVRGIVQSAHELSDWRYYVRRNPWLSVGAAFAVGFMVSPRRREIMKRLESVDLKSLLGQAGLALAPGTATSGLAMKLLAIVGPIAARSAASFIAQRLSGVAPPADDGDKASFEQVGKPR